MSSIKRLNLLLLIIVVLLAVLNFLPEDTQQVPLTNLDAENIQTITINSKQKELHFDKDNTRWQLQSAPSQAINDETLSRLLGILKTHSYRQFEKTENNLSAFGLNSPLYQLTLDKLQIQFGTTDPVQNHRYVLVNNKIHLINDLYLQFFLADETFFYKKSDKEN